MSIYRIAAKIEPMSKEKPRYRIVKKTLTFDGYTDEYICLEKRWWIFWHRLVFSHTHMIEELEREMHSDIERVNRKKRSKELRKRKKRTIRTLDERGKLINETEELHEK